MKEASRGYNPITREVRDKDWKLAVPVRMTAEYRAHQEALDRWKNAEGEVKIAARAEMNAAWATYLRKLLETGDLKNADDVEEEINRMNSER